MPGINIELHTTDSAPQVYYTVQLDTDSPLVKKVTPNAYLVLVDEEGVELAQIPLNPFSGHQWTEKNPKPHHQIEFYVRKELLKNSYLIISHSFRRQAGLKVRLSEPEAGAPSKPSPK